MTLGRFSLVESMEVFIYLMAEDSEVNLVSRGVIALVPGEASGALWVGDGVGLICTKSMTLNFK